MEFSVPYNGDVNLINQLVELRTHSDAHIREVFLSGPQEHGSSGRVAHNGNFEEFERTIGRLHDAGLRINLVMNSTCQGVEWYSDGYADYLNDFTTYMVENLGIAAFTVANPIIMALIHQQVPSAELSASVLGDVDCVERAIAFKNAGASVITPDVSINRDLHMLSRIKEETGVELKVMVNEGCLYKCPYRKFHFNAMSHISANAAHLGHGLSLEQFKAQCDVVAGQTFFGMCGADLTRDSSLILKSGWIRPEDLNEYSDVSTFFKISGRTVATHAVVRMIKAYMEQSYDGDLMDIMDSSLRVHSMSRGCSVSNAELGKADFFKHVSACNHDCTACNYCNDLAARFVKTGELTPLKESDKNFLNGNHG